jgi:hypothetical protein
MFPKVTSTVFISPFGYVNLKSMGSMCNLKTRRGLGNPKIKTNDKVVSFHMDAADVMHCNELRSFLCQILEIGKSVQS